MPKENNMSHKDEKKKKELSDKIANAVKLSELQGKNMTEFKKFGLEDTAKARIQELRDKKTQMKEEAEKAAEKAEQSGGPEAAQGLHNKIEPVQQEAEKVVVQAENDITAIVEETVVVPNTQPITPKKEEKKKNEQKSKKTDSRKERNKPLTPEERIEKIRKEGSEESKKVIAEWDAEKAAITGKLQSVVNGIDGKFQKGYERNFKFNKKGELVSFDQKGIVDAVKRTLDSVGLPIKSVTAQGEDYLVEVVMNDGKWIEFGEMKDDNIPQELNELVVDVINHYVETDEKTLLKNLRIVGAIDSRYAKKLGDLEDTGKLYASKPVEQKPIKKTEPVKKAEPVAKNTEPVIEKKIQPEQDQKIQAILESIPEYTDIMEYYNNPALAGSKEVQAEKKMLLEQPMIYFLNQMLKKDESGKGYYYDRATRAKFQKIYGELVRLKTGQAEKIVSPTSPVTVEPATTVVEEKKEHSEAIERLQTEIKAACADETFGDANTGGREFPPEVKAQLEKMGGVAPEEEEAPTPTLFVGDTESDTTIENTTGEYISGRQVTIRNEDGIVESGWVITGEPRMRRGEKIFTVYKGGESLKAGSVMLEFSESELDELNTRDTKTPTATTTPPAPTVATTPPAPSAPTVERLNLPEDQEKKLREKLSAFNITLEDMITGVEGFKNLSYGQQRMVLENLGQITLGRIEDEGLKNQQLDAQQAKLSKWNGKIWKTVSNKYQIATKTKETAKHIMAGGLATHGALLRQLVKGVETVGIDIAVVEEKDGKETIERLEAAYTAFDQNHLSQEEVLLVKAFNTQANMFARIPNEWSLKTASSSEQKKYTTQKDEFERLLGEMVMLKRKELGNSISVEEHAVRYGIEIRNKVLLNQFLTNNPDFEERLSELNDPSVLTQLGDIASLDKGISLGLGFAIRSFAGVTLGATGWPVAMAAGAITGTVGGIRRHNRDVIAKEKAARRSGLDEVAQLKKSLKGNDVRDLSVRDAALVMSLDGRRQAERLNVLVSKIKNLDAKYSTEGMDEKKYQKEKFLLMQALRRREMYVTAKMTEGTINFGSDAERAKNHLAFMSGLTDAQTQLVLNEKNPANEILLELYTDKENRSNARKERFDEKIRDRQTVIEVLEKKGKLSKDDKELIKAYKKDIIDLTAEKDNIVLPGIGEQVTRFAKSGVKTLKSYLPQWIVGRPQESTYTPGALTDQDKINLAKNPGQRAELLNAIQKRNTDAYQSIKNKTKLKEVGKAALMGAGFGAVGYGLRSLGGWLWDSGKETFETIRHFSDAGPGEDYVPIDEGGTVPTETDTDPVVEEQPKPVIDETTPEETEVEKPIAEENADETTTDETTPEEAETTPTEIETTPQLTDEAKIGKGEGIEHAFRRQIEANEAIAKSLGWNGTQDLHEFSGGAAHRLAEDLGYVSSEGEIRVGTEGVGYQLSLDGDDVGVSEYDVDGNVVESHTTADDFEGADSEKYEYQTKSGGITTESVETEKTVEGAEAIKEAETATTEIAKNLETTKNFEVDVEAYKGPVTFTYDESGNVTDIQLEGKLLADPEKYLNDSWLDNFGYGAPGVVDPKMEALLARVAELATYEELLKSLDPQKMGDEISFLQEKVTALNASIESEYGDIINDNQINQIAETTPADVVPKTEPTQETPEVPVVETLTLEQLFEKKVTDATNTLLSRFFVEEGVLLTEAKYGPETSMWQELSSVDAGSFFAENTEGTINPEYVEFAESLQRLSEDTGIELAPTEGQTMESFLHDFVAQTLQSSK